MPKRAPLVVTTFALALLAAGCTTAAEHQRQLGSTAEREMTLGIVQKEIHAGMAQDEVATALGSPNIVTRDADGAGDLDLRQDRHRGVLLAQRRLRHDPHPRRRPGGRRRQHDSEDADGGDQVRARSESGDVLVPLQPLLRGDHARCLPSAAACSPRPRTRRLYGGRASRPRRSSRCANSRPVRSTPPTTSW